LQLYIRVTANVVTGPGRTGRLIRSKLKMNITNKVAEAIADAVFRLEFWADSLVDIRAQRKEIIARQDVSRPRRKYLLEENSDVTAAIRECLAEAQKKHIEIIQGAADRIAEGVATVMDRDYPTLSANECIFDYHQGENYELV